jgi:hypothetical protein
MRWYSNIGRRVWPYEIFQWLFCDRRTRHGPALAEYLNGDATIRENKRSDARASKYQAPSGLYADEARRVALDGSRADWDGHAHAPRDAARDQEKHDFDAIGSSPNAKPSPFAKTMKDEVVEG